MVHNIYLLLFQCDVQKEKRLNNAICVLSLRKPEKFTANETEPKCIEISQKKKKNLGERITSFSETTYVYEK